MPLADHRLLPNNVNTIDPPSVYDGLPLAMTNPVVDVLLATVDAPMLLVLAT